jgi:hypothetical protein
MHTNMQRVVVIEHVEHGQDEEITIIIFEEDINDEYPNEPMIILASITERNTLLKITARTIPMIEEMKEFIQKTW